MTYNLAICAHSKNCACAPALVCQLAYVSCDMLYMTDLHNWKLLALVLGASRWASYRFWRTPFERVNMSSTFRLNNSERSLDIWRNFLNRLQRHKRISSVYNFDYLNIFSLQKCGDMASNERSGCMVQFYNNNNKR